MSDFLLMLVAALVAGLALIGTRQADRIDRLEQRVNCLERPYGASSVAGRMLHGRFVVTQPATVTRCPK